MVRSFLLVLGLLVASSALGAQDLGRTDRLWREYLSETVRRGLPLLTFERHPTTVPFWPDLHKMVADARTLEPSSDITLIQAWIDRAEGNSDLASTSLLAPWPRPALQRFSPRQWGEALFVSWAPGASRAWVDAWQAWKDKAYSPAVLVRGLEVLESFDPPTVLPLLIQANQMYPEDRRFLGLILRHPESVSSPWQQLARDRLATGGWSRTALQALLTRAPSCREGLLKAGYEPSVLDAAVAWDYGTWWARGATTIPLAGSWTWDADTDGEAESFLTFDEGGLVSWTRRSPEGLWTLALKDHVPETLTETRSGTAWVLQWDAYPSTSSLEYHWGTTVRKYRFRPFSQWVPLGPSERLTASTEKWPVFLATLWLPLDPRALATTAASVETWEGRTKVDTVYLAQEQVWLEVQDQNRDGRDDTWLYFRSGSLASVYRDLEGHGEVRLRELYRQGELTQVQSRSDRGGNEFVLFPREGVQLWDPHGDGRPLDRRFIWPGGDSLSVFVFTQDELPWQTMPPWEPQP